METEQSRKEETWPGYVDWKSKPATRGRHGGFLAASFVLGVEVMENLAFLANASNLVLYFLDHMHFSPARSANAVTNFMGTAFLLALVGGFLSDAYFPAFRVFLFSSAIEFLGLIVLTIQAYKPSLQPPTCEVAPCQEPTSSQTAMLFVGLYLVAIGVGGIKGSLPTHGAEQFDESTPKGRIQRSTFFNYFVFCLSAGGLIAVTFVVWIEDNKGWKWGFLISTLAILFSIPIFLVGSAFYRNKIPDGSPFTAISKVLISATLNTCLRRNKTSAIANMSISPIYETNKRSEAPLDSTRTESLKFLNKALEAKPVFAALECTAKEVEEVKIVMKILPTFASTIILNCCLAQLSTFSVQQAATMDTSLGFFKIPPASLPFFPITIIMALAPLYNHIIVPFARKLTKTESGISHLRRIGTGLLLSIVAMGVAALVEIKRKRVATEHVSLDSRSPLPITFFWIAFQYALLGSADLFTLAGMLEFFFTEAPSSMRSLATSLSWASLAAGYYLSSVMVSTVNAASGQAQHKPWLKGANLNDYHLERFYLVLCVLTALNFVSYLFWANRYNYKAPCSEVQQEKILEGRMS